MIRYHNLVSQHTYHVCMQSHRETLLIILSFLLFLNLWTFKLSRRIASLTYQHKKPCIFDELYLNTGGVGQALYKHVFFYLFRTLLKCSRYELLYVWTICHWTLSNQQSISWYLAIHYYNHVLFSIFFVRYHYSYREGNLALNIHELFVAGR